MPEKRVFDDNEKQLFENSLVWTELELELELYFYLNTVNLSEK